MEESEEKHIYPAVEPTLKINDTAREMFDDIYVGPMEQFIEPLQIISENKHELVWGDEHERNDKAMRHARTFIKAVINNVSCKHAEAAKHIEGSTCDLFLEYLYEKLDKSLLSEDQFEDCYKEMKDLITSRILQVKDALEVQHDEQPKQKSDLEVMVLQTDLFESIHIHHALLCCQIANDCDDPEQSDNFLENLEKEHLLSDVSVSYDNEHVPKYVMARCGDVLYVCFKWVQFHNFGGTEKSYRGEICTGVVKAARKVPLKYFAREIIQNKRVVFSGHSSGGAVACLVFLFLLEKFKHQSVDFRRSHFKCITFGLMPLADHMFKQYVESIPGARDCFCHIVQKNDIIPKLFGTLNMTHIQNRLWELVHNVLKHCTSVENPAFPNVNAVLQIIVEQGMEIMDPFRNFGYGFDHLDIFGTYYILDTSKAQQKYIVVSAAEEVPYLLRLHDHESLRHMRSQYLINHKIERYAHEVELALLQNLPDMTKFKTSCRKKPEDDITPKITEVRFENIGEQVIAKIGGSSMWFVYNVSIDGVNGNGTDLKVDVKKSSESEVETRMRGSNIVHDEKVRVRVKTHFQNSKYLPSVTVPAKTTTYMVTRRQQQLAKHSPRGVIELAYLSALLERRQEGYQSKRFKAIRKFFESAVSVVPLESIFHAVANGKPEVVFQCCDIISSNDALANVTLSLDPLIPSLKGALSRLSHYLRHSPTSYRPQRDYRPPKSEFRVYRPKYHLEFESPTDSKQDLEAVRIYRKKLEHGQMQITKREEFSKLNNAYSRIYDIIQKTNTTRGRQYPPCSINLEVIYPSADVKDTRVGKVKCCKAPMTLLVEGRKELNRISEELMNENSASTTRYSASNANTLMLEVINGLRKEFETCSTLLGAFMESQAQIPLEKAGGDKYVNKLAKHARLFGLSVWGLLILPFKYLNQLIINNVSEDVRQIVIEFSRQIHGFRDYMLSPSESHFPDYDEKLEFLVASMKQSWTCNQKYVSYSLERQLEDQCTKRNILHNTPVDEILHQWNDNFENETLTLVPNEYRRLVARWIKWSLMINNLRENLASQTAVGVIGLVNSGKSKFVRTLFGKETITGTTDQKRTTVPLIYNLSPDIKGLDVIDFPGVDDRDESIPDLAKLLLSLTRIVVFVVDYRRAHTESTKDWLTILERENVPVLICLSFADKLFAELMGNNGDYDIEQVKHGVEKHLNNIKEVIGQPEGGHQRDFKLTVFAFDNDSKLNTDESKEKLRKAGLSDELDVGRWIAEKLQDYEENDLPQNVIKFINEKETSTLNSNRRTPAQGLAAEENSRDVSTKQKENRHEAASGDQPTSSTSNK